MGAGAAEKESSLRTELAGPALSPAPPAGRPRSSVLGMAFLAIEIPLTAPVSAGAAPNYDAVDYINENWVLVGRSLPVASLAAPGERAVGRRAPCSPDPEGACGLGEACVGG